MKFRKRTYYFLINDIRGLKRDPMPIFAATVLPIIAWIFLAFTFSQPTMQDIPAVVVDYDNSALSREITRAIDATIHLKVAFTVGDIKEAEQLMLTNKAFFMVIIDKDAEKKVKNHQSAEIQIKSNGSALTYSKLAYRDVASVLVSMSASIQVSRLEELGISQKEATVRARPVETEINSIGNTWLDYSIFVIPGVVMAILQMASAFSTMWLFRLHVESESGRIIPHRGHRLSYFIGKITPLLIANIFSIIFAYSVILPFAGITVNDCYFQLIGLTVLFSVVSMGMGALFSLLLKNLVTGMQMGLLINAPAFVFSGYTYPRWAMPEAIRVISNIEPLTHFLDGFFPMLIFNTPTDKGIIPLLVIGAVLWGAVLLLLTRPGDFARSLQAKLHGKKSAKKDLALEAK